MTERTPNMNTIRHAWVKGHPFPLTTDVEERIEEFNRALEAHDKELLNQVSEKIWTFIQTLKDDDRDALFLLKTGANAVYFQVRGMANG